MCQRRSDSCYALNQGQSEEETQRVQRSLLNNGVLERADLQDDGIEKPGSHNKYTIWPTLSHVWLSCQNIQLPKVLRHYKAPGVLLIAQKVDTLHYSIKLLQTR